MLALVRLLQLASPAFPIGGYSHSQGLESAIEHADVIDEATALTWITAALEHSLMSYEIPMLREFHAAWSAAHHAEVTALNDEFLATRESAEFRAATVQMGYSMRALLAVLPGMPAAVAEVLDAVPEPSLPCVWSAAATVWQIASRESALAYAWAWTENQVLVAIKSVPLGQSAGQRLSLAVGTRIAQVLEHEPLRPREDYSNFTPGLAILSARHETQYSRLFRS